MHRVSKGETRPKPVPFTMTNVMLRKAIKVPGGIAHYVVGSAYLVVHMLTHEHRARALLES